MKVEINGQQIHPRRGAPVEVGNVYGNAYGKPFFRLVLGVVDRVNDRPWKNIVCIRLDTAGNIVGAATEPEAYVREHQDLIGKVVKMPNMKIEWFREPQNLRRQRLVRLRSGGRPMTDSGESNLPLQYEDGPDYCTVRDAQGRDFALTMQPDLMRAMEKAFSDEIASFMRQNRLSIAVNALREIHGRLWRDNEPYDERIGDLKSLALAALTDVADAP